MVLRLLTALFLLTSFNLEVLAKTKKPTRSQKIIFKKAKRAFTKGLYKKTLTYLRQGFDLEGPGVPPGAHVLAAYSYEKLGELENANNIFKYLIKTRFRKVDKRVMRAYKEANDVDDLPEDIPEKLVDYYVSRGLILAKIYIRDFQGSEAQEINKIRNEASMFAAIAEEVEVREDDAEEILSLLENFDNEQVKKVYKQNYFVTAGLTSWRDIITLTSSSGVVNEIKATTKGYRFGGGWRKANDFIEYNIHASIAITSATAGENTSTFSYFQNSVPVTAYTLAPGFYWKPISGDVAIGASLPIMYRSGDYTQPDGFTLDDTSILSFGLLLEGRWSFKDYSLNLKFGKMAKLSSSLWSIDFAYEL